MKTGPQFVNCTIKRLQQRYGAPIDYYRPLTKGTDLATGVQTCSYTSFSLRRILLLPFKLSRGFVYDSSYLAGNGKDFSFGAFHDEQHSTLVVRQQELSLIPQMNDHISWRAFRYDIKDIETYPDIQVYVLTVVRTKSCKDRYFRNTSNLALVSEGGL